MEKLQNIKTKLPKELLYFIISAVPFYIGLTIDMITIFTLDDSTGYVGVLTIIGVLLSIILSVILFCIYIFKSQLHIAIKLILIITSPITVPLSTVILVLIWISIPILIIIYLLYKVLRSIFKKSITT